MNIYHRTCNKCHEPFTCKQGKIAYCDKCRRIRHYSHNALGICEVCKKQYSYRITSKKVRRFCSKNCQNKAQSMGLVKCHSSGYYGYRPDLERTFRSTLEANFARVCNHFKWKWEFEKETFATAKGYYTPDFVITKEDGSKEYIETRGWKRDSTKTYLARSKYNLNIVILYQREFEKKYGYLKDVIPHWEATDKPYISNFNPEVYDKRICPSCGKEFLFRKTKTTKGECCSKGCAAKFSKGKKKNYVRTGISYTEQICETCSKVFKHREKRRFCSHDCYAKSMIGKSVKWQSQLTTLQK